MRRFAAVASVGLAVSACASDVVMPDLPGTAVCGDGIVEPGEECDNGSAGCVDCQIVPTWTCPDNVCSPICGDGVVGTGPTCEDAHRDTDCDLTGWWAMRENDYTCDALFNSPQSSSNWYLYGIAQSGGAFHVISDLNCGIHITGSVTVDYTIASLTAVMYENPMDGRGPHGSRQGTASAIEGGCGVTLERWYLVGGVTDAYLPADFSADPPLSSLPPLPTVANPIDSTTFPAGATDPDGDGFPGIALELTGLVSGVRHDAQRVWKQYATVPGTPLAGGSLVFSVPGAFDEQENVLQVSQCGNSCSLITTPANASMHGASMTFSFLGKTLGSARVAPVIVGTPGQNVDDDLATCANLRLVLPHDPTPPPGVCQP
jgi:hypothetical protein